jgi:hypothetical protein
VRAASDTPDLAEQFRHFAVTADRDGAPRYRKICEGIAAEPELIRLLDRAPETQRRPNLLLAAVHFLLLSGVEAPLAAHYPTVLGWIGKDDADADVGDPYPPFAQFCKDHHESLCHLVATRSTQTNEIGRCAALLPAFATVATGVDKPLALVDLGSAAGLNLLFDRYRYTCRRAAGSQGAAPESGDGRAVCAGDPRSDVRIDVTIGDGVLPDLATPPVAWRRGVDLHPVDPTDADASLWLLACQWPDHPDRFDRLAGALALARGLPDRPVVETADIVDAIPGLLAEIPDTAHPCFFHTWVAAYLSPARQEDLLRTMREAGAVRPVTWLFAESPYEVPGLPVPRRPGDAGGRRGSATALVLVELAHGVERVWRLADMHPHGQWITWWGPTGSGGSRRSGPGEAG